MNKLVMTKILFVLMILFVLFSISSINICAGSIGEIVTGADDFIQKGEEQGAAIQGEDLKNLSNTVYNLLLALGTVISVIIGVVLGVQFMTGSVEQKVKVKESLFPFVVGNIVIFGAFGIWKLILSLLAGLYSF